MDEIVHQSSCSWQKSLQQLITKPEDLLQRLQLDRCYLPAAVKAAELFPLKVSEHYLKQIEPGNIADPLLRQILPLDAEFVDAAGFDQDPLQESKANPVPGLLHKYASRVLISITQACAVHCRYCFRRGFDYKSNNAGRQGWDAMLQYIQQAPAVNEVIYSGGDPLTASDNYLRDLTCLLASLPQLTRLRIHSRLPILIPERINDEFIHWLTEHVSLKPVFVLHCNHPREISVSVRKALEKLHQAGIMLLNQSVLLKGVNDHADTLIALSETLFAAKVLPYYLHLLDRVQGTAHFEVEEFEAKKLLQQVSAKLPGYLVPKLVREVAGESGKQAIWF